MEIFTTNSFPPADNTANIEPANLTSAGAGHETSCACHPTLKGEKR